MGSHSPFQALPQTLAPLQPRGWVPGEALVQAHLSARSPPSPDPTPPLEPQGRAHTFPRTLQTGCRPRSETSSSFIVPTWVCVQGSVRATRPRAVPERGG